MDRLPPSRLFNRDFTAFWLAVAAGAVGDALVYIALPFLVLGLEGAGGGAGAGALATVLLLGTLPRFAGPVVGALADRVRLRIPLAAGAAFRAALFVAIALVALHGDLSLWMLYLAAPLNGIVTIFTFAAASVALPRIVPTARLAQANSLMQAATMGIPLVGLGAGGALVATVGPAVATAVATPCFLLLAAGILVVRFPAPAPAGGLAQDMGGALALLARRPALNLLLVGTLVLNATLNLLNVLMPVLMERTGAGARGYGLFESLVAAGTLVGVAAVTVLARTVSSRRLVALSQVAMAVGFVVLAGGALARRLAGGAVLGAGLGIGEVASITLLQLIVPDGMRGKVLGLVFPANAAGLAIGASVAGLLADRVSSAAAFLGAGGLLLLLAVGWVLASRGLREGDGATAAQGSGDAPGPGTGPAVARS